jgi:uncharacterized protein (DUF1697 family)
MHQTLIALLRGVNVGGAHALPMEEFSGLLKGLGLEEIRTYIQSGNAVFRANKTQILGLGQRIQGEILRARGFAPEVILFGLDEMEHAVRTNPYPEADSNHKALHLVFLASAPPSADLRNLETVRAKSERYALSGRVLYIYAPEGIGKSKLFGKIDKTVGVAATARNWRTACKLLEMAREVERIQK